MSRKKVEFHSKCIFCKFHVIVSGLIVAAENNLYNYTFDDIHGHVYAGEGHHSNDSVGRDGQDCSLQNEIILGGSQVNICCTERGFKDM